MKLSRKLSWSYPIYLYFPSFLVFHQTRLNSLFSYSRESTQWSFVKNTTPSIAVHQQLLSHERGISKPKEPRGKQNEIPNPGTGKSNPLLAFFSAQTPQLPSSNHLHSVSVLYLYYSSSNPPPLRIRTNSRRQYNEILTISPCKKEMLLVRTSRPHHDLAELKQE